MEIRNTQTFAQRSGFDPFENFGGDDELTRQRLETLLALNRETACKKTLDAFESEKVEAGLMKNPLSAEQIYSYLGLLLGLLMPTAFFLRLFLQSRDFRREDSWVFGIFAIVTLVSSVVGYFSGKTIGKIVRNLEESSWLIMLLLLPFVGLVWGALSGGAGGIVIFGVGAIFGGLFGAVCGGVALPAFTIFHRLLKKDDQLDERHFIPLALGVTCAISAFVLGF